MAKDNFIIKNGIFDYMGNNLNKENIKKLIIYISKYIDVNSKALLANGPWIKILFTDLNRDQVNNIFNIENKEIKKIIKSCPSIMSNWNILNDPFNVIMMIIAHYCLINKMENEAKFVILFLTIRFYSSRQIRKFPYEPNKNITDYVVNHLSNKFKIKKTGTIYELLVEISNTYFENYKKMILNCSDDDIRNFIPGISTRISSIIGNLRTEFDKAWKSGNYLNTESELLDKDEIRTTSNLSADISKIVVSISNKIINSPIDMKLAKIASSSSNVSNTAIVNCINTLNDNIDEDVQKLMILIIQLFLMDGSYTEKDIKSWNFITYSFNVYKKSNTNDESIIEIKKVLDRILTKYSPNYIKTNRIATKIQFRRALFMYIILIIQKYY